MTIREQLFRYGKIYDWKGSEALFIGAMKESVRFHQINSDFYGKLCKKKEFDVEQIVSERDLVRIPMVPVDFYKKHEIKSIPDSEVNIHATSSGTTGQKSQVFLSESDVRLGTKMIKKSMWHHRFISLIPTNYLLLGYEPDEKNAMGNVKVLTGMTKLAPAKEVTFALRKMGETYQLDFFGVIDALQRYNRQPLPVRIFGFPSYLFMMLSKMEEMHMKPMNLGKKSIIFTGGGWKKYDDIKIDKTDLYHKIEKLLGIPGENCRDFYSAVEHSVAYPECSHHHMHIPIWSRVLIRDVKTLEPLGFDKPGFINFISPLVEGMPLSSVLMSDLAVLRHGEDCGCGIRTPYFEILGRAKSGQGKSCSVSASQYLKEF